MATLACVCGYSREVPEKYIGKKVKCPQCQNSVSIEARAKYLEFGESPGSAQGDVGAVINDERILEIPDKIKELLHPDEKIMYMSRPSKNALTLSMIVNGIAYGIAGLSLYFVGIIIVLPIALAVTYYSWKNKYYVITDSRTIVSQGIFNIAIKIINNKNIQIISVNTGIIDRWLNLNSIELSTAGQGGGGAGILAAFPGISKGSVVLKQVVVKDVIRHFYNERKV